MFIIETGHDAEEQLRIRTALYQPPLDELKKKARTGGTPSPVRKTPRRTLSITAAQQMMTDAEQYDREMTRGR